MTSGVRTHIAELDLYVEPQSRIDEHFYLGASAIHGQGILTDRCIQEGEVVIVWGGALFTTEDFMQGRIKPHTVIQLTENVFLGDNPEAAASLDDFLNHSCSPNVVLANALSLQAWRQIEPGEELVGDYSTWMGHPDWQMKHACNCGQAGCRHLITGNDWSRLDLQRKYGRHFSGYLLKRIESQRAG